MTLAAAGLVGLALVAVVIASLVRAHAELLRRVERLEVALARSRRAIGRMEPKRSHYKEMTVPEPSSNAADAAEYDVVDVVGTSPDGSPAEIALRGSDGPTLLAFLSTSCGICVGLWQQLAQGELQTDDPVRVVVLTKDAAQEDLDRVRDLAASAETEVLLAGSAWDDYEVPGSPYFILVGGSPAELLAEGRATSLHDLTALVRRPLEV